MLRTLTQYQPWPLIHLHKEVVTLALELDLDHRQLATLTLLFGVVLEDLCRHCSVLWIGLRLHHRHLEADKAITHETVLLGPSG